MRFVPGLVSHIGIKLGSHQAVLSKSIVQSEQEYYMVSEVKYETETQPSLRRSFKENTDRTSTQSTSAIVIHVTGSIDSYYARGRRKP